MSNFEFEVPNFKIPSSLCSKATLFLGRPILTRLFTLTVCLPALHPLSPAFPRSIHCLLTHRLVLYLKRLSYPTRERTSQERSVGSASLTGVPPGPPPARGMGQMIFSFLLDKKIIEYESEKMTLKILKSIMTHSDFQFVLKRNLKISKYVFCIAISLCLSHSAFLQYLKCSLVM